MRPRSPCSLTPPEGQQFQGWEVDGSFYASGEKAPVQPGSIIRPVWQPTPTQPVSAPTFDLPKADQLVSLTAGDRATLTVSCTAADSQQCYMDCGDGRGFVLIAGACEPTFTTAPVSAADSGVRYLCRAVNDGGAADSPIFTLQVASSVTPPETGDDSQPLLWLALMLLSLCGAAGFSLKRTSR